MATMVVVEVEDDGPGSDEAGASAGGPIHLSVQETERRALEVVDSPSISIICMLAFRASVQLT